MSGRPKNPNKMKLTFQVLIDDEMKEQINQVKNDGVNFQPFLRNAIKKIIEAHEKGELYNI